MDTEDRDRFLIAWLWHCPRAEDRAWSVKRAFETMNRRLMVLPTGNTAPWTKAALSQAEVIAIFDGAAERPIWNPDKLAKYLGLTYAHRTQLRIRTIGACDVSKRQRKLKRKYKDYKAKRERRRSLGMRPQFESLSRTQQGNGKVQKAASR
jgi:hypothetical protein